MRRLGTVIVFTALGLAGALVVTGCGQDAALEQEAAARTAEDDSASNVAAVRAFLDRVDAGRAGR